jgi:hypothetical protein
VKSPVCKCEEFVEALAVECSSLPCPLNLDVLIGFCHDDIGVDLGVAILGVTEIQLRDAADDAHRNG